MAECHCSRSVFLAKKDIVVKSQTGSEKTAAFAILRKREKLYPEEISG
ncbi:hypothetical protein SBF1_1940007 [Candidatus Desulfosporosinus infrequens]|uniref:Uncharacterized protein n=1 Tax=Candidatus Desulfosporosinus infrequens TaxID=2043169 RepID=A0A2U3KGQ9_9FIRM|nr:hypothetical protein SBF1_1940007 [Candidatus Desulfosporosinus infrequens]